MHRSVVLYIFGVELVLNINIFTLTVKTKHHLYDADLLPTCPFSLSTLPLRYFYWHNKQKKAPKSLQKASTNFKKKEYPWESKNIHEYSKWCFIRSLTSSCRCLECQFFPLSQQSPAHNDCISTRVPQETQTTKQSKQKKKKKTHRYSIRILVSNASRLGLPSFWHREKQNVEFRSLKGKLCNKVHLRYY